jgi:hypothetical protein
MLSVMPQDSILLHALGLLVFDTRVIYLLTDNYSVNCSLNGGSA